MAGFLSCQLKTQNTIYDQRGPVCRDNCIFWAALCIVITSVLCFTESSTHRSKQLMARHSRERSLIHNIGIGPGLANGFNDFEH
jgi:hypothetical protein